MESTGYLNVSNTIAAPDAPSITSTEDVEKVSSTRNDGGNGEDHDDQVAVTAATRALLILRIALISVWLVAAVLVSSGVFIYTSRAEESQFRKQYSDYAAKVLNAFKNNIEQSLWMIDLMSVAYTSYALDRNLTWPFVTLPDFEIKAIRAVHLVQNGGSIAFGPVVSQADRDEWATYSVANQDKLAQGLKYRKNHPELYKGWDPTQFGKLSIPPIIWKLDENNNFAMDDTPGPALPVWQDTPIKGNPFEVNYNVLSHPETTDTVHAVLQGHVAVLSRFLTVGVDLVSRPSNTPLNILFYPVFDNFHDKGTRKVVGVLGVELFWQSYLKRLLPHNADGIIAVMSNTCGQVYTFEVLGEDSRYVGQGDLHDAKFDDMAKTLNLSSIQVPGLAHINDMGCEHSMKLYPSTTFRSSYISNTPKLYTISTASIFLFTAILFLVYDWLVNRRHRDLKWEASRSNAIVKSLFPVQFHDRLFRNAESRSLDATASASRVDESPPPHHQPSIARRVGLLPIGLQTPKIQLKTFLRNAVEATSTCSSIDALATTPIADFFPNATVMFADIAGFTAWCSEREPTQVFVLLESIYCAFDAIAKRKGVFKVETIGDCYMAVTGLPDPQEDHAAIMATFARACIKKMQKLTKTLEASLGPGTAELSIRIGLHSGPVTAGVLRGDKSRFQLFGDTVNTASRMESNGEPGRIQLSEDTAMLLVATGKGHWVAPREEVVVAKGKGDLQTYWLIDQEVASLYSDIRSAFMKDLSVDKGDAHDSIVSRDDRDCDHSTLRMGGVTRSNSMVWGEACLDDCQSIDPNKISRLVDWNVDVLLGKLKAIVASRQGPTKHNIGKDNGPDAHLVVPRDEVAEVIVLPCFDPATAIRKRDPATVVVGSKVITQLRKYVSTIALMYRNNSFHNFEHASHVTMSSNKLLQRIMSPDDFDYQREGVKEKHRVKAVAGDLHERTYGITSDPLAQFTVVFAALIHDLDHPGLTNMQLIQQQDPIAVKYNNKSVAEQNSIAKALDLLMSDDFTDLRCCIYSTDAEARRFRQLVVNSVMATDLFDSELRMFRKKRWEKAFSNQHDYLDDTSELHSKDWDVHLKATTVIEHIIQASDVAHTMQHWHIYQKWNKSFFNELFISFQRGLMPTDPSVNWYEGELDFFDNYVIPLAKKLKECGAFGVSGDEYLNYAQENRKEWALKGKQIVASWRDQWSCSLALEHDTNHAITAPTLAE